MLIIVGTRAVPRRAISAITVLLRPVPCSTESMPAATRVATECSPNACVVIRTPGSVSGRDRRDQRVVIPRGREIADRPVDPVTDQLDPAVPGLGLRRDLGRDVLGGYLDADVAQVAAHGCDMLAGAGQSRHVGVMVEFGIGVRRAGIPDREHTGVAIDRRRVPEPRPAR